MQNVLSFKKFRKWNSTFNIFPLKYYNQIVQWRSVETCVTHFFGYKIGIFKTEIFELCRVKTVHTDFTCPLSLDFCRNSKSGKVHFGAKFEIEWNPFSKNVFARPFTWHNRTQSRSSSGENSPARSSEGKCVRSTVRKIFRTSGVFGAPERHRLQREREHQVQMQDRAQKWFDFANW